MDLANEYKSGLSIADTAATATVSGTGIDFQDCGPAVTADFVVGENNGGDDTSCAWKLQEADTLNGTYADITGATGTAVSGDTTKNLESKTFFNRSKRFVRAVATLTGSSVSLDLYCVLRSPKTSY